jgi:hypothetical protein
VPQQSSIPVVPRPVPGTLTGTVKSTHGLRTRGADDAVAPVGVTIDVFPDRHAPMREFRAEAVGDFAPPSLDGGATRIVLADRIGKTVVGSGSLNLDARLPTVGALERRPFGGTPWRRFGSVARWRVSVALSGRGLAWGRGIGVTARGRVGISARGRTPRGSVGVSGRSGGTIAAIVGVRVVTLSRRCLISISGARPAVIRSTGADAPGRVGSRIVVLRRRLIGRVVLPIIGAVLEILRDRVAASVIGIGRDRAWTRHRDESRDCDCEHQGRAVH